MRYLVRQPKGTEAVAQMLRTSQRTIDVKNQIKKPPPDRAARLEREMRKRWQPQIWTKAKAGAASVGGMVIGIRARMGYATPIGLTDQHDVRHLPVALPLFTPPASSRLRRPPPATPDWRRARPKR
jgi:hypothetical protein